MDRILVSSPRYLVTSPWLQPVREKCAVVPLGVDSQRFAPPAEPYAGRPTLLFVGRLRYYKGLGVLIDALTELQGVRLLVAGTGPMESEWRARASQRGVAERVVWLGEVADAELPGVLAAGDVFALPAVARSEAFGTVLLEAMASRRPVVSTELGTGTSWVNVHGTTGLVVPPGDPPALARALGTLLSDDGLRRRMGEAGHARVRAELTQARMVARVESLYREVAA